MAGAIRVRLRGVLAAVVAIVLVGGGVVVAQPADVALAADASGFDRGYIISDANFYNGGAMTAAEIQSFLNARVASCRSGYTCLKTYAQAVPAMSADRYCSGMAASASMTAAQIIQSVAVSCGISPMVLLVMLEKEQSLVTDTWPLDSQYAKAMGYSCPDTAACDPQFAGFFYQVYYGARQFQLYTQNPTSYRYRAGQLNAIQYHPNAGCGTESVFIVNQATANLYIYTPYTPNAAALANLYGTGDSCSSYGNRNFWRIYSDWFGSPTQASDNPAGAYDVMSLTESATSGVITVAGWTYDKLNPSTVIQAHVYLTRPDGSRTGIALNADGARPDVGRVFPEAGPNHGYSTQFTVSKGGLYQACVYGIAVSGAARLIGCKSVVVATSDPVGSFDALTSTVGTDSSLTLTASGWALQPNSSQSQIEVHVYVTKPDGSRQGIPVVAANSRPDVAAVYAGAGDLHGFSVPITATTPGTYTVCAYAIGYGWQNSGRNVLLGCKSLTFASGAPLGSLDVARIDQTATSATLTVSGWTFDVGMPTTSIQAHVYTTFSGGGTSGRAVTADQSRADIARVFPSAGAAHGYTVTRDLTAAGTYSVCAYGIGIAPFNVGKNAQLGCRTVVAAARAPLGSFDVLAAESGELRIAGWALDQDIPTTPTEVHLYVTAPSGSRIGYPIVADTARTDIARVFPSAGAAHGYDQRIPVSETGTYTVCAYAIGTALLNKGSNQFLGCKSVTF